MAWRGSTITVSLNYGKVTGANDLFAICDVTRRRYRIAETNVNE